jgi:hypothetical protein
VDALAKLVAVALRTVGEGGVIRVGVERPDEPSVAFVVRTVLPARSIGNAPPRDESRGGLGHLVARGIITAQGGQLTTEPLPTGARTVVTFPLRA